jgi:hypothetical protein
MQMVVVVAGEALAHHNLNRGNVRLNFYRRFIEARSPRNGAVSPSP